MSLEPDRGSREDLAQIEWLFCVASALQASRSLPPQSPAPGQDSSSNSIAGARGQRMTVVLGQPGANIETENPVEGQEGKTESLT